MSALWMWLMDSLVIVVVVFTWYGMIGARAIPIEEFLHLSLL